MLGVCNFLLQGEPYRDDVKSMIPEAYTNETLDLLKKNPTNNSDKYPYQVVLQNWYDENHTIGRHRDDISQHVPGTPIFSISWGGTRRFVIEPYTPRGTKYTKDTKDNRGKLDILVENGDLVIMGGTLQETHTHQIPKYRKTMDPPTGDRISYTIRAFNSGIGGNEEFVEVKKPSSPGRV